MIFAGDFNTFFNLKLEAKGGKQLLKRKFIAKLVEIKEVSDICDIWRIRNPNNRNFTFRENHSTGFKERRLYYIFISNCLQEFVNNTDILPALSTDHPPLLISLLSDEHNKKCSRFWQFNNSLVYDEVYVKKMKKIIAKISNSNEFKENAQKYGNF